MGFQFDPLLLYVCRLCKETFPDTDKLKMHKLENHLGDCLKISCIVFEEIFLDQDWIPLEDTKLKTCSSEVVPVSTALPSLIHKYDHDPSSNTSTFFTRNKTLQIRRKPRPNPCVLLTRLRRDLYTASRVKAINCLNKQSKPLRQSLRIQNKIQGKVKSLSPFRSTSRRNRSEKVSRSLPSESSLPLAPFVEKLCKKQNKYGLQDLFKIPENDEPINLFKCIRPPTQDNNQCEFRSIDASVAESVSKQVPSPSYSPSTSISDYLPTWEFVAESIHVIPGGSSSDPITISKTNEQNINLDTTADSPLSPIKEENHRKHSSHISTPLATKQASTFTAVSENRNAVIKDVQAKRKKESINHHGDKGTDQENEIVLPPPAVQGEIDQLEIRIPVLTVSNSAVSEHASKVVLDLAPKGVEPVVANGSTALTAASPKSKSNNYINSRATNIPGSALKIEPDADAMFFEQQVRKIVEATENHCEDDSVEILTAISPPPQPQQQMPLITNSVPEEPPVFAGNSKTKSNFVVNSISNPALSEKSLSLVSGIHPTQPSPYNTRKKKSVVNYTENQSCRHCNKDFYTVEDVEDHEKLCVLRKNCGIGTDIDMEIVSEQTNKSEKTILLSATPQRSTSKARLLNPIKSSIEAVPAAKPASINGPGSGLSHAQESATAVEEEDGIELIGIGLNASTRLDKDVVRDGESDSDFEPDLHSKRARTGSRTRTRTQIGCGSTSTSLAGSGKRSGKSAPRTRTRSRGRSLSMARTEDKGFETELDVGSFDQSLAEWLKEQKVKNHSNIILLEKVSIPTPIPTTIAEGIDVDENGKDNNNVNACVIEYPIQCKLCRAKLFTQSQVKIHVEICWHSNKTKHIYCTICAKSFRSPYYLKRHNVCHHWDGPRPTFKCEVCGKEYSDSYYLKVHQKSFNHFPEQGQDQEKQQGGVTATSELLQNQPLVNGKTKSKAKTIEKAKEKNLVPNEGEMEVDPLAQEAEVTAAMTVPQDSKERRRMNSKAYKSLDCDFCSNSFFTKRNLAEHKEKFHLNEKQLTSKSNCVTKINSNLACAPKPRSSSVPPSKLLPSSKTESAPEENSSRSRTRSRSERKSKSKSMSVIKAKPDLHPQREPSKTALEAGANPLEVVAVKKVGSNSALVGELASNSVLTSISHRKQSNRMRLNSPSVVAMPVSETTWNSISVSVAKSIRESKSALAIKSTVVPVLKTYSKYPPPTTAVSSKSKSSKVSASKSSAVSNAVSSSISNSAPTANSNSPMDAKTSFGNISKLDIQTKHCRLDQVQPQPAAASTNKRNRNTKTPAKQLVTSKAATVSKTITAAPPVNGKPKVISEIPDKTGTKIVSVSDTSHTCGICSKSFPSNRKLSVHQLNHTGVRPFKCTVASCDSVFAIKSSLWMHQRIKHWLELGLDQFPCPISTCEQIFGLSSYLKYHMQKCHSNSES